MIITVVVDVDPDGVCQGLRSGDVDEQKVIREFYEKTENVRLCRYRAYARR